MHATSIFFFAENNSSIEENAEALYLFASSSAFDLMTSQTASSFPTACICSACRFPIFPQPIIAKFKSVKIKVEVEVEIRPACFLTLISVLTFISNRQNFSPFF